MWPMIGLSTPPTPLATVRYSAVDIPSPSCSRSKEIRDATEVKMRIHLLALALVLAPTAASAMDFSTIITKGNNNNAVIMQSGPNNASAVVQMGNNFSVSRSQTGNSGFGALQISAPHLTPGTWSTNGPNGSGTLLQIN
jgi:hypothetical protein